MTALIIRNARLLDVRAGELHPGSSIRIEDEKIVEVRKEGQGIVGGDGAIVLDAAGGTLMPGLIDAHVHAALTTMDFSALAMRQASWLALETRIILQRMLLRGFTTVRDAGGLDLGISRALARGLIKGPRVFRSGRVLSQTGGHGDTAPPSEHPLLCACSIRSNSFSHVADGVDAVRKAAREELKAGAHQIKVMAGGGVATPSDPIDMVQYTEAEIRAAVEEAQARRTYAFAHAYVPDAIHRAVTAGVRSIEHGNLIDGPAARFMAEHGCYLVPTLVAYDQLAKYGEALNFPAESLRKLHDVSGAGLNAIDTAVQAGVKIGFGTDLLGERHDAQSEEFALRAQVLSNVDIIRSATCINAELIGMTDMLGVLKPSAYADFLVIDGDPLSNLSLLAGQGERIKLIVRSGEIIKNELL